MLGAFGLLALFFCLIVYVLSLGFVYERDYFLRAVTGYIAILIFLYVGINVCMVIGLAPVVAEYPAANELWRHELCYIYDTFCDS